MDWFVLCHIIRDQFFIHIIFAHIVTMRYVILITALIRDYNTWKISNYLFFLMNGSFFLLKSLNSQIFLLKRLHIFYKRIKLANFIVKMTKLLYFLLSLNMSNKHNYDYLFSFKNYMINLILLIKNIIRCFLFDGKIKSLILLIGIWNLAFLIKKNDNLIHPILLSILIPLPAAQGPIYDLLGRQSKGMNKTESVTFKVQNGLLPFMWLAHTEPQLSPKHAHGAWHVGQLATWFCRVGSPTASPSI